MYKHHRETAERVVHAFKEKEEIIGILLTGSIAHGFEKEDSDTDILLIVRDDVYKELSAQGTLTFYEADLADYDRGYVDYKYISLGFMREVAERGSEPARFAFEGAKILYAEVDHLAGLLQAITRYPRELKEENIRRFHAQFQIWNWYCHEGIKHRNAYLLSHAVNNLILFGGRMLLAYNEVLYPYHKWFTTVLEKIEQKPENLTRQIETLLLVKDKITIEAFYNSIINFTDWGQQDGDWGSQFVKDSELNWMEGRPPVADL